MADTVIEILTKLKQKADEVVKTAERASVFQQDCLDIKSKTEYLSFRIPLLRRAAARAQHDLYERPTRRIIYNTDQVLDDALALVSKCRASALRRVFTACTTIPTAAFVVISSQLSSSIGDVTWLIDAAPDDDDRYPGGAYFGLPPIAAPQPIICLIWEQISILCYGSIEERTGAAAFLVVLASDNDWYGQLIIEEGGVAPLLKLAEEGRTEDQVNAARVIGLAGRDPKSVHKITNAGAWKVFAKILKEGHVNVQIVVAWALSELAAHDHRREYH
ncbi:hypothetical protein ABFX02_09G026500 [Erythranthe guttata]